MGLFDRFKKQKWENKNPEVRLEAIKELNDQNILVELAKNDSDSNVRSAAVKKISDESVLIDIAKNDSDSDVRNEAIKKITDESAVVDIIKNESSRMVCESGFEKINKEEYLSDIAKNAFNWSIRCRAIELIDDETTLKYIAKNDSEERVRRDAIKKINNKGFLNKIVDTGSDNEKLSALSKLADMDEIENNIFVLFNLCDSASIQVKNEANSIVKKINTDKIVLKSDVKIKKGIKINMDNLIIDGNGYSIIGDGNIQWIDISGENITLKNITFKDFSNYNHGGVIRNTSNSLTIENCSFINNHVEKYSNSDSERFGGVIDNGGNLKVINSNFRNNNADSGGCIHTENGVSELKNCIFENNLAKLSGGGVLSLFNGDLRIKDCNFKNNKSHNFSGALRVNNGNVEIKNSEFIDNEATQHGGAISINEGNVKILNTIFEGNKGLNGGAINQPGGSLILKECIFNNNVSKNNSVSVYTNGNVDESNCEFKTENDGIYK